MQRRLNLAMALVHVPEIVVLDEPEAGLDPQSRALAREYIQSLARKKTVILTTQNMEEANRLCHRVGIIRTGKMVAIDAPEKLKAAIDRQHRMEVSFDREVPGDALRGLYGVTSANRTGDKWQITAKNPDAVIRSLVAFSQQHSATIITLNTLAPSLDDAFLRLTQEESP